jgi:homoserine dehydrogenase
MGGLHPAYEFTKALLESGKSVVTSNKELVAEKGSELLQIAEEKNVNYLFEASVGGGIPVLRPIVQCLSANDIFEIQGILNGTTNYIMTRMIAEGVSFEEALAEAQRLGYAEKDPTADIEGHDACRKICILAALAFGKHVNPNVIHTEGITKITSADTAYADFAGMVIKLIGRARKTEDGKFFVTVYPAMVSRKHVLANVEDVFNAVLVRGDAVGDVMFYGRGAGKLPTASAVVADIVDCVKHLNARKYLSWEHVEDSLLTDYTEDTVKMCVRVKADKCRECVKAEAEKLFGEILVLGRNGEPQDEIAFITPYATEKTLLSQLEKLPGTVISTLRILD